MRWSSNDIAGVVEAPVDDPRVASGMTDPPTLRQYDDGGAKPSPGIVSGSRHFA